MRKWEEIRSNTTPENNAATAIVPYNAAGIVNNIGEGRGRAVHTLCGEGKEARMMGGGGGYENSHRMSFLALLSLHYCI